MDACEDTGSNQLIASFFAFPAALSFHPHLSLFRPSDLSYPVRYRRMLANAGYPVLELRRERYGKILLGDLPEGEHTPVAGEALEWAKSVFELQATPEAKSGDDVGDKEAAR